MSKLKSQTTLYLKAQKLNPATGLLFILFLVFLIIVIWDYLKGKGLIWEPPVGMLFMLALYFIAFAGWRVEVTPEEITVVTFFWSRKTVRRSDITSWTAKTGWKGGDKLKVPYRRLEIHTTKNAPPFIIPTKLLRREDYQTLVSLMPTHMKKGR